MTNAKSTSIWLFPILLWALACGPTAPATGGGNAAVEPTPQTQRIAPGVQMQNASSGERAPSDAGPVSATTSVRTPPTPTGALNPTPIASVEPTLTPTTEPTQTPTDTPSSIHAELYDAINTIRAAVSEFPLEVKAGLETAAQIHAERGAWNSGLSVEPLLFDQGVQCRVSMVLTTGYPDPNPRKTREEALAMADALYLPDATIWATINKDYATHLFWWMEWPDWDTLFLGNYTHMGYGSVVNPKMSHPARGNHPGVIILCQK